MKNRRKSIIKGAAAGFVGGIAGAVATTYLDRANAARGTTAPLTLTPEGHRDPGADPVPARDPLPWVFGGLVGAAYGAAVELEPSAGAWQGAAFGMAVNRISESGIFPGAGLSSNGQAQVTQAKFGRKVKFAVFGIVAELVRRSVRRGLA